MFRLSKYLQVELMGHRDIAYKLFKKLLKASKVAYYFTLLCAYQYLMLTFLNLPYSSVKCYPALILLCTF